MSEEQNQNNKTNENDKDVTASSDIKNEQISLAQKAPTSSSSPSSHFSAHLVTTINREAIATPHIDNIIEEEEEEEEETCLDENVNNKEKTNPNQTNLNESAPNQKQTHTEFSKFTLEPVHLDIESPQPAKPSITDTPTKFNIEKIDTSDSSTPILIETNKSTPSTSAKHSLANLQGNVSPIAPHNKAPKSKPEDENVEVVEIRVEEGYATRQMDEYFRQTIAAIKEELTKKLENKNEKGGGNKHRNAESGVNTDSDDNEFDDYDNETFDNDEANEYSYDHDRHSNECNECMGCCDNFHDKNNSNHANSSSHNQHHHRHICNRRNLLYHHLMISNSKKRSKTDKANAWLALLGCFLNQFIIEGLCYNYANLFDIVQKEFKTTSKLVSSMPATFLLGFYLLLAPISLFLAKKFGTRRIALIGSFISTVSLLISSLLNDSIIVFSIFYGILNGIGLSLIYVPSVISTSKWFLKKRLFANSVTILGACLGAAIYPLTSEFLLRKYELFDSLLILAGVQLNCVVGSMLLREHKSTLGLTRKKKKSQHGVDDKNYKKAKTKSTSSAHLLENEHTEHKPTNGDLNKKQPAQTNGDLDKLALVANKRRSLLNDSETESTTASTNTVTNYTLKQYWRKFVQTRKTQANTKKNLFHLIAEEKRKTRTLSKTSLEDGFVITTSNNLLAPNDESHVIVSRHAAKIQTAQHSSSQSSSRAASKFFTRIANSLRSLAHVGSNSAASTSSPIATTHHSKNHLAAPTNLHEISETSKTNSSNSTSKQPALIPLMSVFSGPINTDTSSAAHDEPENNHIPTNLVNVFNNDTNPSITLTTTNELNQTSTTTQVDLKNEADNCDSDSDEYDEDEGSPNINNFRNKINSGVASNQISRYLSYRNSLANSVRGSLMECSVPEDKENEDELHSGVDGSSHDEDEILNNSAAETSIRNKQLNNSGKRRRVKSQLGNRGHLGPNGTSPYTNLRNHNNRINNTLNSGVNGGPGHNENDSGYAMPTLTNIRRFLSIMDSSSFYNAPMNLESVEFNLRNSLIKKCSDSYRKNHKYSKKGHDHDRLSLFLSYLSYLTSFKLFKNALLVVLNLSFFFNIIGICVPLIYISEYTVTKGLSRTQSIYFVCLIGLMAGFGRIISTIVYKVNESNAKNRIFSYVLTLLLIGGSLIVSTFLCDTVFSFAMFAIAFGCLFGFNLNLRSLVIYDIAGLEWSDDSLFFYILLSQSIGAFIGIPIAGGCFIIASLLLMPGRQLRNYCMDSLKVFNKYYLQKRY